MEFSIPADALIEDKLRLFETYLEEKYQRTDAELGKHLHNPDRRSILKAERAEVAIIQGNFRKLFEKELRWS